MMTQITTPTMESYWDDDERSTRFLSYRSTQSHIPYGEHGKFEYSIGDALKTIARNDYSRAIYKEYTQNDYDFDYDYDYRSLSISDDDGASDDDMPGSEDVSGYDSDSEGNEVGDESVLAGATTNKADQQQESNPNNHDTPDTQENNHILIDDVMYKKFCYC